MTANGLYVACCLLINIAEIFHISKPMHWLSLSIYWNTSTSCVVHDRPGTNSCYHGLICWKTFLEDVMLKDA
jgi:hypothetical protein